MSDDLTKAELATAQEVQEALWLPCLIVLPVEVNGDLFLATREQRLPDVPAPGSRVVVLKQGNPAIPVDYVRWYLDGRFSVVLVSQQAERPTVLDALEQDGWRIGTGNGAPPSDWFV